MSEGEEHYVLSIVLKKVEKTSTEPPKTTYRNGQPEIVLKSNSRIVGDLVSLSIKDVELHRIITRGVEYLRLSDTETSGN